MTGTQICKDLDTLLDDSTDLDTILQTAIELLHNSESCFHWTGIYELYSDDMLRLGPFMGAPTDHTFIASGQGICGSAIAEKKNKNIPNVLKESNYLACSTATSSELVILIRKGDKIYGQIDIDSHDISAFNSKIEKKVEQVANWLADVYEQNRYVYIKSDN